MHKNFKKLFINGDRFPLKLAQNVLDKYKFKNTVVQWKYEMKSID